MFCSSYVAVAPGLLLLLVFTAGDREKERDGKTHTVFQLHLWLHGETGERKRGGRGTSHNLSRWHE
jgi:hypothetical protein